VIYRHRQFFVDTAVPGPGTLADQNDIKAQFNYGLCLRDAEGTSRDLLEAPTYFKLGRDRNCALAQVKYGLCLRDGEGISRDLI
jgi:TPR repeat protein